MTQDSTRLRSSSGDPNLPKFANHLAQSLKLELNTFVNFNFRPGRKRGLRSSVELRLTCQGTEQVVAPGCGFDHVGGGGGFVQGVTGGVAQPTPPPSYESAVRDRRGFSFSSMITNKH